jgi:phospholipase C
VTEQVSKHAAGQKPSRRTFIAGGAAALGLGAAASQVRTGAASAAQQRLIEKALAASASSTRLSDIQHVVILMQENRSFDHYFGTLSAVRGFSDPGVQRQVVGASSTRSSTSSASSRARAPTLRATCSHSTC